MALKIKDFELPDKSVLEEAYLRLAVVTSANVDYEYLEPMLDSNDLITMWTTRLESKANVFVYGDEIARKNRVSPVNWFEFIFDLDLKSNLSIYDQAYNKLKEIYPESEDC
jgi:hypothetical protein